MNFEQFDILFVEHNFFDLYVSASSMKILIERIFYLSSTSKHQNIDNEANQLNEKRKLHLNSLWSIWYGILATYLQGYLALHGAYRFLGKSIHFIAINFTADARSNY